MMPGVVCRREWQAEAVTAAGRVSARCSFWTGTRSRAVALGAAGPIEHLESHVGSAQHLFLAEALRVVQRAERRHVASAVAANTSPPAFARCPLSARLENAAYARQRQSPSSSTGRIRIEQAQHHHPELARAQYRGRYPRRSARASRPLFSLGCVVRRRPGGALGGGRLPGRVELQAEPAELLRDRAHPRDHFSLGGRG